MYLFQGAIVPREGTSVATDQIRAQLTFRIPIIDLQPHARVAADNVSLESQRMADITIIWRPAHRQATRAEVWSGGGHRSCSQPF